MLRNAQRKWADLNRHPINWMLVLMAALALMGSMGRAHSQSYVFLAFDACQGSRCEHYELPAEDLMSCAIFGQLAALTQLHQEGRDDWTLKGWKCLHGIPS